MPSLTKISIEHYRGFYERREILPAQPNGNAGSGLTVVVGPNNSGKSTLVRAIRLAVEGPGQIDMEHRHQEHPLNITLTNDAGEQKSLTNPDLGAVTVLQGNAACFPNASNILVVPSRRAWSPYTGTPVIDAGAYWQRAGESMTEDTFLVSRLAALSEEQRSEFDSVLKELLPEIAEWKIELSRGQTFVLYSTQSGAQHAADLFGEGMMSLFRVGLSIIDSTPEHITVIDEPELSLHPQAQKALAIFLSRVSKDRQIIMGLS